MKPREAVVAGATGAVGSELVRRLLATAVYTRVIALARRPLDFADARLVLAPARFGALAESPPVALGLDRGFDAFCCLGTTIRKAGSRDAFRTVDHVYVLSYAQWARDRGAHRLIVVSALGADPASATFYCRVKGEMESALRALKLRSNGLVIVRPSLLDAPRAELRMGERLALAFTRPLGAAIPARVRPIKVEDVAQAMLDAALAKSPPPLIESGEMQGAAARASAERARAA